MVHRHVHRRQPRDALAFAEAAADAFADAFAGPKAKPEPAQTFVSVVYVTADPTFEGPIGGYTTVQDAPAAPSPDPTPQADEAASTPPKSTPKAVPSSTPKAVKPSTTPQVAAQKQTGTDLPSSIAAVSTSVDPDMPLLAAEPTSLQTQSPTSFISSSATDSAGASKSKSTDSGMSTGAKAGLAIGIILLIGTALALILFFLKKRRNAQKDREQLSEKPMFAPPSPTHQRALSTNSSAIAPRLSLRPVTQFIPNFGQSRGNGLQPGNTEKALPMIAQDSNRNNPFGNHAEAIDSTNARGPPVVNQVGPGGEIVAAGAVAGASLARGASRRGAKPMDLTNSGPFMASLGPPSPTGTEFSMTSDGPNTPTQTSSSVAIAAAGGPPNTSVHRVQLDFKPSMDDELELHAGQLIRMLHEYDDGWALCIRLDRSRQGVVPRTCLSTRPVKPRPQQNGPRGPPPPGMRVPQQQQQQQRPQSPSMNQGQGYSPAMNNGSGRPMTPTGGPQSRAMTPNSQQGRPMTPQGQQRPMTPTGGPQYRPQGPGTPNNQHRTPNNVSPPTPMDDRRNSPPFPSPLNPAVEQSAAAPAVGGPGPVVRKPVGQAM